MRTRMRVFMRTCARAQAVGRDLRVTLPVFGEMDFSDACPDGGDGPCSPGPFRVSLCAACTSLTPFHHSRVTLSPRQEHS